MNTAEKRNPALVELILVILFFALSAMILVQVFVKAHVLSEESRSRTLGMVLAEDLLEQWKENGKDADAFAALVQDNSDDGETVDNGGTGNRRRGADISDRMRGEYGTG